MHQFKKSDHILTVIPLFHVGGLNIQTIPALHIGATVTIHKKFEIKETFKSLEYFRTYKVIIFGSLYLIGEVKKINDYAIC